MEETRVPGENCISTHCHQHISSLNAVSSSFWNLSNFNIHWLNRHDILIYIDMSYDHGYDDPLDLRKGKMLFSTKKKTLWSDDFQKLILSIYLLIWQLEMSYMYTRLFFSWWTTFTYSYKCSGYVPCCVTVNTHTIVNWNSIPRNVIDDFGT